MDNEWIGEIPKHCDICRTKLDKLSEFVDGSTVLGSWAIMCRPCHVKYGRGFGTGHGQLYRKASNNNWIKVV